MFNKVLIVEDETLQRQMLEQLVKRRLTLIPVAARNGREALDILTANEDAFSLIIMDLNMPVMGGDEALPIINQQYPDIPVIMLTGSKDTQDAVTAMKNGATDFITKPFEADRMIITIENALKLNTLKQEVTRLKQEKDGAFKFDNLIGHSNGLNDCINMGRKVASSDIPALITGPTGSGKEVFSRAIHGESARAHEPFIAVNCGAIPSQLVESTLFGHEKGASTGATEKVLGKFREADGGTIFLDEIGELPLEAQVKLLRVLQQKEVETVGAAHPIPINVRIISATNRDLAQEVKKGNFREDLYFRLNVLEIELPSLHKRKGDIIPLAQHFIKRFCAQEARIPIDISDEAATILKSYDWPGNVRQLENAMNRAIVLCDDKELGKKHFKNLAPSSDPITSAIETHMDAMHPPHENAPPTSQNTSYTNHDGSLKTMEQIEIEAIKEAMNIHGQNITQAAKALNIAKSTFYRKLTLINQKSEG